MSAQGLSLGATVALEVAAYVGVCLQLVHTLVAALMLPRGRRAGTVVLGVCVCLHLSLGADLLTCLPWHDGTVLATELAARGILGALWANVVLAAVTEAFAACRRSPRLAVAGGIMALCTPPVADALGAWWNLVAMADVASFLVAACLGLRADERSRHDAPTAMSVAEALSVISVGILVTDGTGASVFMNDEMRHELEELGLPTDLGDLTDAWARAAAHEVTPAQLGIGVDVGLPFGSGTGHDERRLIALPDGRVLLGMVESPAPGGRGTRVFSIDVAPLVAAARELTAANEQLAQANADLAARLADVQAIARQAAFLRLRAAVHDVIGQRLSILQRLLEAPRLDDASVSQLRDLVGSVLGDLRDASTGDPAEGLDDIVEAFALVDVEVRVEGALPADREAAAAFVRVVREAATNACRHAHAHRVSVRLGQVRCAGRPWATLEVSDDGATVETDGSAAASREEGTGTPGMRRAVEGVGGVFELRRGRPFVVLARIPLPEDATGNGGEEAARDA